MPYWLARFLNQKAVAIAAPAVPAPLYDPAGIFLPPDTALASVGATNVAPSGLAFLSFWIYGYVRTISERQSGNAAFRRNHLDYMDILSHRYTGANGNSENGPRFNIVLDEFSSGTGRVGTLRFNAGGANATATSGDRYNAVKVDFWKEQHNHQWNHIAVGIDTNKPLGQKRVAAALNGVDVGLTGSEIGNVGPFLIDWATNEPFGFKLQNDGNSVDPKNLGAFWVSDAILDVGYDPFDANGKLRADLILRCISNGKPVDPGLDGSLVTGRKPTFYFKGSKASFPTSAGANALALQAVGDKIYNAPFGPAGPPNDRAYVKWTKGDTVPNGTSMTVIAPNNAVKQGDYQIIFVELVNGAAANHQLITPLGWDALAGTPYNSSPAGYGTSVAAFARFAPTDNAAMPTINWVVPTNLATSYVIVTLGGVNQASPIHAASVKDNFPESNSVASNSLNAAVANLLRLDFYAAYTNFSNLYGGNLSPPASQDAVWLAKAQDEFGDPGTSIVVAHELIKVPGATGTRTATNTRSVNSKAVAILFNNQGAA
jgi:hypothetical protein